MARPGCSVSPLVPFPVTVPENCPYFPYEEAYITVVTRTEEKNRGIGAFGPAPPREDLSAASAPARKRQKRLLFEALVRDGIEFTEG